MREGLPGPPVSQPGKMAYANRMTLLVENLSKKLSEPPGIDPRELPMMFLNLSRSIDHAVASNQKPTAHAMVLNNFKQFALYKEDENLFPSMMVLMLSIKSACLAGWFNKTDADELLGSFKVLFDYSKLDGECWKPPATARPGGPTANEAVDAEKFISQICTRYFPRLAPLSVVVALTAKPGYQVRGCDFQITSQLSTYTKLRLFVCKMDSLETSACLVTPPLLSFLLNGRGVERRMYLSAAAEAGPQLPTDITQLLRIGCNFLQIIGDCTATYFMVIAAVKQVAWTSSSVTLQDYMAAASSGDSDDELIVGSSRVSLRCPISHKRIVTPVKGMSCRHHQAFDYDSYMEINDRRPSWRCPCCNTHVNCNELRFDRQIEKVLKEVGENVFDVMIDQDGSWTPDVAEEEADDVHAIELGQGTDAALNGSLDGVISLSDDEEDGPGLQAGTEARESIRPHGFTHVDTVDRKPDIRSLFIREASPSLESVQVPAPSGVAANRDAIGSPVLNAMYSPISEFPDQQSPATVTNARSSLDPQGLRTSMQNQAGTAPQWYYSSQSVGGHSSENRSSSAERSSYPQPPRSTVIQALPAPHHLTNLMARGRPMATPNSNSPATAMTAQQLVQMAAPRAHELRTGQHQISSSEMAEMYMNDLRQQGYNPTSTRNQTHLDGSHRNQRQSQRSHLQPGAVQNGLDTVRDAQVPHQFGVAGAYQATQGQQNPSQFGQQLQYPTSATHQSGAFSQQVQQEQWQRQMMAQRLAQATHSISRVSPGGGTPSGHVPSYPSGRGAMSGGSQQVLARQMGSHPSYAGVANTVTNASVPPMNSATMEGWTLPPQVANWRPAGTPRMRGAIGAGSTPVISAANATRTGVPPATNQMNAGNRARATTSAINMVPASMSSLSTTTSTSLWGDRSPAVVAGGPSELYNNPGSLSPSTVQPAVPQAPPPIAPLESTQVDIGGAQDSGYWSDLFMQSSP